MTEKRQNKGKVWLVGAGPSDPGLMTLKGRKVLADAEVVIYDALLGPEILRMIPDEAEAVNVGKRAGHHTLPQEEISALLLEKAREGKRVVRLKGGDPFLFGRGGEELELLSREGIDFEVVPGVSSATAVPAYQGIPLTHRDYASSVHIITGHRRENMSLTIDFEALVKAGGTLVFLMGVTALDEICKGLLEAGMSPDMPAALLMQGTRAGQKRISAKLSALSEEVRRQGALTPAILVVGKVCALAERFSWYEREPLGGVRILLTRPRELIEETAEELRSLGAEVLEIPTIKTEAVRDKESLDAGFEKLEDWQWIVFTSRMGVRLFFEEMERRGIDRRKLYSQKFAVIGPGTAKALKEYGYYADLMPELYDAEHLGRSLADSCRAYFDQTGRKPRVLIPRSAIGSPALMTELEGAAKALDLPIYETKYELERFADLPSVLDSDPVDYLFFTSASTVKGFLNALPKGYRLPSDLTAACIGKQTAKACEELDIPILTAPESTIGALIEALTSDVKKKREAKSDGACQ